MRWGFARIEKCTVTQGVLSRQKVNNTMKAFFASKDSQAASISFLTILRGYLCGQERLMYS